MAVPPVIDITSSQPTQSRSISDAHRLPTVSASQALNNLQNDSSSSVPTGLPSLDGLLAGTSEGATGGIPRGKVTELWGPSGAGKTAIAIQAAINELKRDASVVWVDAATTLSKSRLKTALSNNATEKHPPNLRENFTHIQTPTLSHLLSTISHPPANLLVPNKTSLLIIDDLNTLLDLDYPRSQFATANKTDQQKWQSGRRYAVLGFIGTTLNKLATLNNLSVIVTTGCSTRGRADSGLGVALVPGIGGLEWDGGVWNRAVIFRDFGGRFIGLQKCQGRSLVSREEVGEVGRVVGFDITAEGSLVERQAGRPAANGDSVQQVKSRPSPVKPRKRVFDEVADSEGEDVDEYGWAETDEEVFAGEGLDGKGGEGTERG